MKVRRYFPFPVLMSIVLLALAGPTLAAQPHFEPGKERWGIKTSVPEIANLEKGKRLPYEELIKLEDPPDVRKNDRRYQEERIPAFKNALNVTEGDILTTRGWLHLVATEKDGDYHIQISGSQESQESCLVIEVPMPEPAFVTTAALRPHFKDVRDFIKEKLLQGKDPSLSGSAMRRPAYVEVTGQLFYDDAHVGDQPRGKKGCKAATLWELHPVTGIRFAPRPAR